MRPEEFMGIFGAPAISLVGLIFLILGGLDFMAWLLPMPFVMGAISAVVTRRRRQRLAELQTGWITLKGRPPRGRRGS